MIGSLALAFVLFVGQAPPSQLHFQARLSNAAGIPLAGPAAVSVRIYDVPSGGAPLWSESSLVTPISGVVNLALGSLTPIPASLFDGGPRYLALQVAPDAEMTPRRVIASVPFAARAGKASSLEANVVTTAQLVDGTIAAADLADSSVTTAKLAANSVTSAAIATGAVGGAEIADGSVTLFDLASTLSKSIAAPALQIQNAATGGMGFRAVASGIAGIGLEAVSSSTSGTADGMRASSYSTTGYAIWARNFATIGGAYGVVAEAHSNGGRAVNALATSVSGTADGVVGRTNSPSGYGIWSIGSTGATGQKNFIQPHPTDPSREIRFTSLEGNESGTYFRGSAKLSHGVAVIEVPEEFRLVSEAKGLTVQLTPIGSPIPLAVVSKSLEKITVCGGEDIEFDFFVQGVRRGFAGVPIVHPNRSFVPDERGVPFGTQYPEAYRRILVENGILNPDFTPNEKTAARLGWTLREAGEERR